jgi:hypothetical protein
MAGLMEFPGDLYSWFPTASLWLSGERVDLYAWFGARFPNQRLGPSCSIFRTCLWLCAHD